MSEVFGKVSVKDLFSLPFQSRTTEDPELEELVESIKAYGVLEPLIVRQKPDGTFEIVAGERRFTAAKKAGLTEVSVIIKPLSDQEACEIQLTENIQRKDLVDIEKAHMLDHMIKQFGYTQEKLAKKLGKSQPWVSQHLAMLKLPENITRVIKPEQLTEGQAREILAAPEEKRKEITKQITETGEVPSSRVIKEFVRPSMAVQCSCCHFGAYEPKYWEGKPVCSSCYDKLSQGKTTIKEPKTSVEKSPVEVHEYKPKETWEHRKAVMTPGISKMDEAVYLALQQNEALGNAGWKFEFQKRYCIKEVVSDVTATKGDVEKPLFLDGEVHVGREDRDEANRELLARRLNIPEVLAFSYTGTYSDAKRDGIVAKIGEALGIASSKEEERPKN
jgi:ParB/RepB/Spo0J family partition protein